MSSEVPSRPNVLLIITDQQRYDTLGCTGQDRVATPNIDRLAENGMLFDQAFCTTPICTPSRASLLSGLYPHTHGSVANHQERPGADQMRFNEEIKVIADYLQPEGYKCGYAGKWHLGTGYDRRGFSDFRAAQYSFDVDRPEENEVVQHARKLGVEISDPHQGGYEPVRATFDPRTDSGASLLGLADHPSSLMCDRAVEFIHEASSEGEPFMLGWSCQEPHPPFVCPEPFFSMYDPADMVLPKSRRDGQTVEYLKARMKEGVLSAIEDLTDDELRVMWARYLGGVSFVDYLVGRLVTALHRENIHDNTLIIFASDHGEMLGSHGMKRKGCVMFEELVHVPLIMVPPGVERKQGRCAELVSLVDLLPTILEYCRVAIPDGLHGVPISSLVEGGTEAVRQGVAGEYHSANWAEHELYPLRMWRTKEFKLIESQIGDSELYDLRADPEERTNLIDDPEKREKLAGMRVALTEWLEATGDTWPDVIQPPSGFLKKRG